MPKHIHLAVFNFRDLATALARLSVANALTCSLDLRLWPSMSVT
jgi:hypothetical protein